MTHIAIGSNIDPWQHVPWAVQRLQDEFTVTGISPFYQTPAIDRPEQDDYWNGIVAIEEVDSKALRQRLRRIEAEAGRIRTSDKYAARTLDLDVLSSEDLQRPFLARCMADLDALPPDIEVPAHPGPVVWRP